MKEYDFGLNWSGNIKEHFVNCLKTCCQNKSLSFLWIFDGNIIDVFSKLDREELRIKVLLDTEATYNKRRDLYARLCYAVKDTRGIVINDPDRAKVATDKSVMHYELLNIGINVPYSVIVRNWEPNSFRLTDKKKRRLGIPFVIKPAYGYGQLGVVRDAYGSIREIAHARNFDRGDNFLLQEKIIPIELKGKRAWFRVFNVFDNIIPCWWDDRLNWYEHVAYEEFKDYHLFPLGRIISKIADITRMAWFSTEIAIDKKFDQMHFVAIDYVNDQCDMTAKSESISGVPDSIVEYTAHCIVNAAYRLINNKEISKKYTIRLKDADVTHIRGLEDPPELLRQTFNEISSFQQRKATKQIIRNYGHNTAVRV